jgi:hypothetical protein
VSKATANWWRRRPDDASCSTRDGNAETNADDQTNPDAKPESSAVANARLSIAYASTNDCFIATRFYD